MRAQLSDFDERVVEMKKNRRIVLKKSMVENK